MVSSQVPSWCYYSAEKQKRSTSKKHPLEIVTWPVGLFQARAPWSHVRLIKRDFCSRGATTTSKTGPSTKLTQGKWSNSASRFMLINTYFRVFFPKKGKLYREVYWGKSEADFLKKRPHCSSDIKKERKWANLWLQLGVMLKMWHYYG